MSPATSHFRRSSMFLVQTMIQMTALQQLSAPSGGAAPSVHCRETPSRRLYALKTLGSNVEQRDLR